MHDQIREYIQNLKGIGDIKNDQRLIDPMSGVLDSLDIAELVVWIESTFTVNLSENDLEETNFRSIDQLVLMLQKKALGRPC